MIKNIGILDIAVIVIYFIFLILTGFISMCKSNRNTIKGYFLAGQFMIWLPVGASLFASNIGSEHFIGLAGSGAAKGISVGAFELNASIILQLLGWVFLPVFINSGAYTLPEYMNKRFGGNRIQCYLAIVSLMMYIFTKISVNLYSASLFIYEALEFNIWLSVGVLLILTGLITVTGGLAAVLYTDTLQCFIMIIGSIILTIISFNKIGGLSALYDKYGYAIAKVNETRLQSVLNSTNLHCYLPSKKAFQMFRSIDDNDMPWLGFILGQTPASIWYWCADQMMVQRVLSARNLSHAKGGTLFAGLLKLLPLFIMVMPGMVSRVLFPDEIACATAEDCLRVCNQASGCTNLAYPKLVIKLLPDGLRGLMLSVMLAALVSDLTSIFNSASTLFTVDIYRLLRKSAKNRELMIVGRLFVLVMIGLSVLWLPVIQNMQGGQLFIYIQAVSGYLSPPIAAVYLMAILWSRGNEKGAMGSLIYGLVIGSVRMMMDFIWKEVPCEQEDTRPWFLQKFHYMYFALFSFSSCAIVMVLISLSTKPQSHILCERTTYWSYLKQKSISQISDDVSSMPLKNIKKVIVEKEVDKKVSFQNRENFGKFDKCKLMMLQYWNKFLGFSEGEDSELNSINTNDTTHDSILRRLYETKINRIVLNIIMVFQILFVCSCFLIFSLAFPEIKIGTIPTFNVSSKASSN